MDLRQLPAIDAASLFQMGGKIPKKEKKPRFLPRVNGYLAEEGFGDVAVAWSPDGLFFTVKVGKGFESAYYPDVAKGDGLELFVDTRGIDSAAIVHKYCHHFVFLPKEKDGVSGAEITRFRTDDKHELSSPDKLTLLSEFTAKSYTMNIHIPESCLFGYDPYEYRKIGLGYVIHRAGKEPQHFPLSGLCYKLESSPGLWAKFTLEG